MPDPSFPTSLRRDPDDPRGLKERIERQIAERIDEAVTLYTLDLLTRRRASQGRPVPAEGNARDRRELRRLRRELLEFAARELRPAAPPMDPRAANTPLAFQVHCAKHLPDYWQRLERIMAAFPSSRPETRRRGLLAWLFAPSRR